MPFPNEHAGRVKEPIPSNASVTARKQIAPGISIILQKNQGEQNAPMQTQAYRFNKKYFTAEEAKAWLKSHDISTILFEPATDISKENETREEIVNRITKELSSKLI